MARVGSKHVTLNERARTIRFDREGVELDLGGIAKGYAVDRAAAILRESGVTSALITSGSSSICAIGAPPKQAAWRVEVNDPMDRSQHLTTIDLKNESISSSGCHEKTFKLGGKTYCHIMDPHTGHPIEGMLGATIITPLGVEAEALSKAAMLNGVEWTKQFAKKRADVRAILYYSGSDGRVASTHIGFLKEKP
jgi:thiamine biosynthesis lipoprotein